VRALLTLAAVVWLALLLFCPILPVPLAAALYAVGSYICHQRAERSFHLFAAQLPVCARCLGIYAGGAAGLLLTTSARIEREFFRISPRAMLVAGAIPTLLTLIVEWSGAWAGRNDVRAGVGVLLGIAVAFVVAQAGATLHYGGCAPRRSIASNRPPTPI
jgi:uncharacterized membrane protein